MEVSGTLADLRAKVVYYIVCLIAQVFLLFALAWNIVAVIVCIILDVLLFATGLIDWLYFSKKIIIDSYGCTFVSFATAKRFTWKEIYVQHTENSSFFFGDSEISGEGVIISTKPISKPLRIGAMTYCRFTHPRTSVFIRFTSSFDRLKRTSGKFFYRGFVADKDKILGFLQSGND